MSQALIFRPGIWLAEESPGHQLPLPTCLELCPWTTSMPECGLGPVLPVLQILIILVWRVAGHHDGRNNENSEEEAPAQALSH